MSSLSNNSLRLRYFKYNYRILNKCPNHFAMAMCVFETKQNMVCLSRPYHFIFFKGCLPQTLLGPFFNILTHVLHAPVSNMNTALFYNAQDLQNRTWYK